MDHEFHSIVEKLAVLEGRIAPKDKTNPEATASKQKKPALFNNLKKDESAIPMVGGVEFAEDKVEEDVLSKVKNSLADYLKSAEEQIKQDKDLLKKKKEDLDIKKKELKDLDLQQKEKDKEEEVTEISIMRDEGLEEDQHNLDVGDRICVVGHNEHQGEFGEVIEFAPSGKFVVVRLDNGDEASMHISDVEFHDDQEDAEDYEDDMIEGDTYAQDGYSTYAQGGTSTYASESAPVKTVDFELQEMGGSVLVEIHGDERQGFTIKRAGRELGTKFKSLAEAELALEMYMAHRKQQIKDTGNADYIEEK